MVSSPTNPWNQNISASSSSSSVLACDWPPLKVHQIPTAVLEPVSAGAIAIIEAVSAGAIAVLESVSAGANPEILVPVEPIRPAAPDSFSSPFPLPSFPINHSPNPNRRGGRNHQNHRRNYHQGNIYHYRYPPCNPNPNAGYTHRPPPPPQQWGPHHLMVSGSMPRQLPFPQRGDFGAFIDVNSVYNVMGPPAYTFSPTALSIGMPTMSQTQGTQYVQLTRDIRNQIEYYFSVKNLETDGYLKSRMDKVFGWVALEVIAKFRRIARLTDDLELIRRALISSEVVELQGFNVRRRNDWQRWIAQ